MNNLSIGVTSPKASLVYDDTYFEVLKTIISKAKIHCLASIFIVDLKSGGSDPDMKVLQILKLLQEAQWRGVDVKLLIGGSRDNLVIAESAETARKVALEMGLNCKWLTSSDVRGSHSKIAIADDLVLTGSHNWSSGAFTNQIQDSILVDSAELAVYCQSKFYYQWNRK